jgi:putative ATP-binding cassette transporter
MRIFRHLWWKRLGMVARPFFAEGPRGIAWGSLGLLLTFLLTINGLNILNSFVGRDVFSALAERRTSDFYSLALAWATVFAACTVLEVMNRFTEQRLALRWRDWLTRRILGRCLADHARHLFAGRDDLDNPDQRITEDVRTFTGSSLSFLILAVNGLLTLCAFAGVLWSITPWLVVAAVGYAAAGSLGTFFLGRPLIRLDNQQLRKEADFRYLLVRLRTRAEGGEDVGTGEEPRLRERLAAVVANCRQIIGVSRNLSFFTTFYNYLPQILPAALVAPLFVRGEVEFGTVTQAAMAFTQVLGAFSLLVTQFQGLAAYAAVVHRLGQLWEATEPTAAAPAPRPLLPLPRPSAMREPDQTAAAGPAGGPPESAAPA